MMHDEKGVRHHFPGSLTLSPMRWHEITGEVERKLLLRDKNVFLKTFGFHFKGPEEPLELSLPLLEH